MSKSARFGSIALALALVITPVAVFAQSEAKVPTDAEVIAAMHAKEAEIGPAKRAFVEQQLAITAEEGKQFWPIYEEHQAALQKFNQRRIDNILAYAKAYNSDSLADSEAHRLALQALEIEKEENAELERTYARSHAVLSGRKAVHYLQIESKLRALVRFKQASSVPVAKAK